METELLADTFTVYANTSIADFALWVPGKTGDIDSRRFPTGNEGEYLTLEPARATFGFTEVNPKEWGDGPLHLSMPGTLWYESGENAGKGRTLFAPIILDLERIASGRIELVGKCKRPGLVGYFGELKAAIGQAYPETGLSLPPKMKGGRPTDWRLDEAYRLIREQGYTKVQAYEWYRQQLIEAGEYDLLREDLIRAAFMKAMKSRELGKVGGRK
jgi:hypothetical protein